MKFTTPATASDPYMDEAPSLNISILSRAIMGIVLVSTNTLPSFASAPEIVCLLPSIKIKVELNPRPLRLIFEVPCVEP